MPWEGVLKKNYLYLASNTRSHYVNKAFGNFIQTKLGIKGGGAFFKQTQLALANAKFDLGKNVPVLKIDDPLDLGRNRNFQPLRKPKTIKIKWITIFFLNS